jgi:hypothetical protein
MQVFRIGIRDKDLRGLQMVKRQALKTVVFPCPARRFLCFEDPLVFQKAREVLFG